MIDFQFHHQQLNQFQLRFAARIKAARRQCYGELIERGWLTPPYPSNFHQLGWFGERIAAHHLRKQRCRILLRSFRTRDGEIDLIGLESKTILFVEVKTRSSVQRGHPDEAVDRAKQEKVKRSANLFLKKKKLSNHPHRFDVIAIEWSPKHKPMVKQYRNAFN